MRDRASGVQGYGEDSGWGALEEYEWGGNSSFLEASRGFENHAQANGVLKDLRFLFLFYKHLAIRHVVPNLPRLCLAPYRHYQRNPLQFSLPQRHLAISFILLGSLLSPTRSVSSPST